MQNVLMRPRILLACLLGAGLVISAVILAPNNAANALPDQRLEAVVGNAPERKFIEVADVNGDGIPDWQETLAAADKLPTINASSSANRGPTTLTDQFALSFAEDIMLSNIYGTLDKNTPLLIENAGRELASETTPDLYEYTDLTINPDDSLSSLRTYGNRIAAISFEHSVPAETRDVLVIIEEAGLNNDQAVLAELAPTINAYQGLLNDTLNTPVPEPMLDVHLALVNAYMLIHEDMAAMDHFFTDPLKSLVHLYRYEDDSAALSEAVVNLYLQLDELGVKFDDSDTASRLIRIDEE